MKMKKLVYLFVAVILCISLIADRTSQDKTDEKDSSQGITQGDFFVDLNERDEIDISLFNENSSTNSATMMASCLAC